MNPDVGQIVHFVPANGTPDLPLAAIVVGNTDTTLGGCAIEEATLCVMQLDGLYFAEHVPHSVNRAPGHWTARAQFDSVDVRRTVTHLLVFESGVPDGYPACGAVGDTQMSTSLRWVTCPACITTTEENPHG